MICGMTHYKVTNEIIYILYAKVFQRAEKFLFTFSSCGQFNCCVNYLKDRSVRNISLLALDTLLPLRGINVTLQFTEKTSFRLFHQPIITAWLRHLVGNLPDYEQYVIIDAPESGHSEYQAGDYYRFAVLTLGGGEALLQYIIECLHLLPYSVRFQDDKLPLRNNVLLHSITDLWHDFSARHVSGLTAYDSFMLQHETAFWQAQNDCRLRWLAPVALLLPRPQREGKSGDKRFCRHKNQLSFSLLNDRVYDTLANLLRQRETAVPARHSESVERLQVAQVFWMDYAYYNAEGKAKPMGGLLGECVFNMQDLPATQWLYWVLGQYVGIGQRRVFGWGRYQLETLEGQSTAVRAMAVN